jgi:hypothetical protein
MTYDTESESVLDNFTGLVHKLSKGIPRILEFNPNPNLIRTSFCLFLPTRQTD